MFRLPWSFQLFNLILEALSLLLFPDPSPHKDSHSEYDIYD